MSNLLEVTMAKELLFRVSRKDFTIEAKRGHGKGGQNRNVTNSACRITHPPSGAVGQSQEQRDYKQNEQTAFRRLIETKEFKNWHSLEVARRVGLLNRVEKEVEQMMRPKNLFAECKSPEGGWVEMDLTNGE
jgi:peptide chain release factor 1